MPPTTDPLGLTLLPEVDWEELDVEEIPKAINDNAEKLKLSALFDQGAIGSRPSAGETDTRFYLSTDEAPRILYLNTGSTWIALARGDDSRLSDARTPTAHAASHSGGTDKLYTAGFATHSGVGPDARSHGLGTTPKIVLTIPKTRWVRSAMLDISSTTFLPDFDGATDFWWIAFR